MWNNKNPPLKRVSIYSYIINSIYKWLFSTCLIFPPNKWDKYLVLFYTGLTLTVVLKEI